MLGARLVAVAAVALVGCGGIGAASASSPRHDRPATPISDEDAHSRLPGPQPPAPARAGLRVPILMYHYIREPPNPNDRVGVRLSVRPADFKAELDWLQANGYRTITFADLAAALTGSRTLPPKAVILTFDDGYEDFFTTAVPNLRDHGFDAVAYVVTGFIGRPGYLTRDQVVQLDRDELVEIGSHTQNHLDLTAVSAAQLRSEVAGSRAFLEELLGHEVLDFCYPAGRFNPAVVRAVQAAGYRDATTTAFGAWHSYGDRLAWTRVRVSGGEGLDEFARKVAG
jgi:peptidoglycan/xylan/chitin deacetylase (PgdA/CDA1 family)